MHRSTWASCQKPKRIPLVAARCVTLKTADCATAGGILWRSAFIFSDKNGVVVIGTFKDNPLGDALLYELIINATPEKILRHPVAVFVFRRQEQHLWLVFFHGRGRRLPVRHRLPREDFHGFHKAVFLNFHQIIKGGIAAEAPRPPVPFAVGNLKAIMLSGTVHIRCAFDLDKIARLIGSKIGKQIYPPCPFKHVWVNLHIGSAASQ